MKGRPETVIVDDPLVCTGTKLLTLRDLLKTDMARAAPTISDEVRFQLRRARIRPAVIDEISRFKPLAIQRRSITTLKLREVVESHGSECKCIVCLPPKAPKTGRFKQTYGG